MGSSSNAVINVCVTSLPLVSLLSMFQANSFAKMPSAVKFTSRGEHPVSTEETISTDGFGWTDTNCEVDAEHSGVVTTRETL